VGKRISETTRASWNSFPGEKRTQTFNPFCVKGKTQVKNPHPEKVPEEEIHETPGQFGLALQSQKGTRGFEK